MGGAKIMVEPVWESESVLRVTNMNPAKQTKGWAKTLITGTHRKTGQSPEASWEAQEDLLQLAGVDRTNMLACLTF